MEAQKGHQAAILTPASCLLAGGADIACQGQRLHLEVDLGIDVGCVEPDVPQPRPKCYVAPTKVHLVAGLTVTVSTPHYSGRHITSPVLTLAYPFAAFPRREEA